MVRDMMQGWRARSYCSSRSRQLRYWQTICWQAVCAAILVWAVPLSQLVSFQHPGMGLVVIPALSFIVVSNILVTMYVPIVLAWGSGAIRRRLLGPWRGMRGLLPTTVGERAVWVLLSLTTGICEELFFRGFVVYYLTHQPWGLDVLISTLISCVLFSLGHAYQGLRGMLQTLLLGVALSGLVMATGSLVLPMIVHTLINMRVALLPPARSVPALVPQLNNS